MCVCVYVGVLSVLITLPPHPVLLSRGRVRGLALVDVAAAVPSPAANRSGHEAQVTKSRSVMPTTATANLHVPGPIAAIVRVIEIVKRSHPAKKSWNSPNPTLIRAAV